MNYLLTSVALLGATCVSIAAVQTNNIVLSTNPGFDSDYMLTIFQDAAASNPTSILFDFTDMQLVFVNGNIDEASDWYLASSGASFWAATIANGDFPTFVKPDFSGATTNPINAPGGSIFPGVNTGTGFTASGPNRQVFGWVELFANGAGLTLLSSAVTYDSPGIFVGSTTTIPEPASTTLMYAMLCAGGLFVRRGSRKAARS